MDVFSLIRVHTSQIIRSEAFNSQDQIPFLVEIDSSDGERAESGERW